MKRLLSLVLIIALLGVLCGCAGQAADPHPSDIADATDPTENAEGGYRLDMTRNEVIVDDAGAAVKNEGNARIYYQIFVGSFSDSNGDGIGDLRGIIERFDYLNDGDPDFGLSLGVEGIWLSPIFTSPSYHKYDVTDYYEIDPQFGTMEDLRELIELCHDRGVQIILDLVINHTAKNHEWFQSFVAAHQSGNTGHKYYDWYSYSTENNSGFSAINGTQEYYECNFSGDMPELNYDNPEVRQAMVDVAKFYLDMGVDGFRFDAAKYIYYGDEQRNADFWLWYMEQLRQIKPDIYTVAEVWDSDAATYPYFASTNCFDFSMSQAEGKISSAVRTGSAQGFVKYVESYLEKIKEQKSDAMLCSFISNHDMDRAAGYMLVDMGYAKMAANLNILTPGSPFIYYGEEIGMLGSRGGSNTDANRRLAMLWGDDDTVKNPTGSNYSGQQSNGTVAEQKSDSDSLYTHYKKLIAMRKANPEIAYGDYKALVIGQTKLAGFISTYDGSSVVVLHNASQESITVDLADILDISLTSLAAWAGNNECKLEGTTLTVGAMSSVVLR